MARLVQLEKLLMVHLVIEGLIALGVVWIAFRCIGPAYRRYRYRRLKAELARELASLQAEVLHHRSAGTKNAG